MYCGKNKKIIAPRFYNLRATTYMIRGKMMSDFTYRLLPQPIYKYILSRIKEKVKKNI